MAELNSSVAIVIEEEVELYEGAEWGGLEEKDASTQRASVANLNAVAAAKPVAAQQQVSTFQAATGKVKSLLQRMHVLASEEQALQQEQINLDAAMRQHQEEQDRFSLKVAEAEHEYNTSRSQLDDLTRTELAAKEDYNYALSLLEEAKQVVMEKHNCLQRVQSDLQIKIAETSNLSIKACAYKVELGKRCAKSMLDAARIKAKKAVKEEQAAIAKYELEVSRGELLKNKELPAKWGGDMIRLLIEES